MFHTKFDFPASPIHLLERDYFLHLNPPLASWPPDDLSILKSQIRDKVRDPKPGSWLATEWHRYARKAGGHLWRKLARTPGHDDPARRGETHLHEAVFRFPSAPLFGIQNKTGFQVTMNPVHQHTLRIFTSAERDGQPIKKLFLMFNGLNELDELDFYYDLAGLIIGNAANRAEVGCLIPPFPAHLTRYPLVGRYAEKPLQRFISDPSDLFRQYLRFMVEMQWLISVLVPYSHYPVTCGIPLLAEAVPADPGGGRCDTAVLSDAIHDAWLKIFQSAATRKSKPIELAVVEQSVASIREFIGWSASSTTLKQRLEEELREKDREKKEREKKERAKKGRHEKEPAEERRAEEPLHSPLLHVVGYSLGGYMAQCVFFTWPYAIGSCSTLCSGGALHSLRPEKIIHEEEWWAITHGLKYELESGLLEGRIKADPPGNSKFVCGLPVSYFTSHFQTFNDIFLQDAHGSYRHRVSEFAPRLFFVVGGKDPIVPTRAVLDSSPPEGINMIEIANLSHFLSRETSGEWPSFWLPTIAGIISSLSGHSERLQRVAMFDNLWNEETTDSATPDATGKTWLDHVKVRAAADGVASDARSDRRAPEPLDSERLQSAILSMVKQLRNKGVLLILRNQIPVTLMGRRVLHRRGTVPHYAGPEVRGFWERLQEQRLSMLRFSPQITIVVPGRLNTWFVQPQSTLSVKHLPVVRELPEPQQSIWEDFLGDWANDGGALYRFDPAPPPPKDGLDKSPFELEWMIREATGTPDAHWILNCLPDAWIGLSAKVVEKMGGITSERAEVHAKLIRWMSLYHSGKRGKTQDPQRAEHEREVVKATTDWFKDGSIEIIRISAAQWNPRFLGERIWAERERIDLLTHSALALARSTPCREPGDFLKDWPIGAKK